MELHFRKWVNTNAVLVLIAVITGPFGTFDTLGTWERLGYWLLVIVGVGFFMNLMVILALRRRPLGPVATLIRMGGATVIAGLPSAMVVLGVESVFRGISPSVDFALRLWLMTTMIGFIVVTAEYRSHLSGTPTQCTKLAVRGPDAAKSPPVPEAAPPLPVLFLRNLSPELGGKLVSLSIEDHYLDVVTEAGRERILKRMADAVAELDGYPGMQIHRSHWVALDAIERLARDGRRVEAVLKDGRRLPVSRPNMAALTEAFAALKDGSA